MNAKFKMPKFGRKLTGSGVMKELLLTTLATTISIVLTFGTAHFVEQRQAKQARRLMAMTIINDIDESIEKVRKILEEEEMEYTITKYMMENMDRIDSIGIDSLYYFMDYVTPSAYGENLEFKKNNESIFNSSQDTWRTLNDKKFLSNVQEFYNDRIFFEHRYKEHIYFQKPLTRDEEFQLVMNSNDLVDDESYRSTCRRLLQSLPVVCYTEYSRYRIEFYEGFLKKNVNLNEENKFLMNITEQDMKDFVNQTFRTIRPVKESELAGIWQSANSNDTYQETIDFHKDHTFAIHYVEYLSYYALLGKMIRRYSIAGRWAMEGDSLVYYVDRKSYKMAIDENGVSYHPKTANDVEDFKKRISRKPSVIEGMEKQHRIVLATNLDQSGTRLELMRTAKEAGHYRRIK